MVTHLPHVADEAARNELSFQEFFERLLQVEHREWQERSRALLARTAGFPATKMIEQYRLRLRDQRTEVVAHRASDLDLRRARGERYAAWPKPASAKRIWPLPF